MKQLRISVVSYLNSLPFTYGMKHKLSDSFVVNNQIPRKCAESFKNNEADIALVPVAFLKSISNYKIITPYCIAADGVIKTVSLLSNSEIKDIKTIYLDSHSLTSINLMKILSKRFYKKEFLFIDCDSDFNFLGISDNEAVVAIGDKVFELEKSFNYNYDLAEEWKRFSNKGFVFACWISKLDTPQLLINELEKALKFGLDSIDLLSRDLDDDKANYIKNIVKYERSSDLISGMNLYLEYL